MKKLTKLAALLSCVLLAGCSVQDLKFWEKIDFDKLMFWKKEEEQKPTPVEKSIEISEIPAIVVSEELDLSKYVTCSGGTGDFRVTVGESAKDFAGTDVTGKKIFAEHSGEVPFTVTYSGVSKEGSVKFVSEDYAEFLDESQNAGYEYGVYFYDNNFYEAGFNNYAENFYIDWFTGEGYVDYEGTVYGFALIEGVEEWGVQYTLTGSEPESIAEVSLPFMFPAESLKSVYVPEQTVDGEFYEAYESIICDDLDVIYTFSESILGFPEYVYEANELTPKYVEFYYEEFTDNEGNIYPAWDACMFIDYVDDGELVEDALFDVVTFCFGEYWYDGMDILAETLSKNKPEGKDISFVVDLINEALDVHNFTVIYSADWYSVNETTGARTALGENPFVYEGAVGLGSMINHYLNKIGSISAYVTETQTYVENEDAKHSYGLVYKDGVYVYEGEEHLAFKLSEDESIFAEGLRGEKENYLFMDSAFETAFINGFNDMDATTLYFTFNAATAGSLFEDLFIGALPLPAQIDEEIKDDIEYLAQFNNFSYTADMLANRGTVNLLKYLNVEAAVTFNESDVVGLTLSFVWEDYDENDNYLNYIMSVTFTDFGTTEIPGEIVVNFGE